VRTGSRTRKLDLLDKNIPPQNIIWYLAWPTIIEQVLQSMVQYVDSAMVGVLGAAATAAVAVNTSTIWLLNGLMNSVAIGFSVLVAREIGAGRPRQARNVVRQSILASSCSGVVLAVIVQMIAGKLPIWMGAADDVVPDAIIYMRYIAAVFPFTMGMIVFSAIIRSSGDTRTPLMFNILTNIINIIGNFLLIFPSRTILIGNSAFTIWGAGMGVGGAALSSAFSTSFSGLCLFAALFRKDHPAGISWKGDWKFDTQLLKTVVRLGTPVALERATLSFGQIALTKLVTGLGTVALASHHLANTAESITYLPPSGFATAATTLVAQSLGSGDRTLAKRYGKLCTMYGTALMTAMGVLMYLLAPQLMGVFTNDAAVIALGTKVLRIEAFAEPFFGLSLLVFGVLRGAGDTKGPFLISLFGMWIVRLPLAWALITFTNLGLAGVWIAMMGDLIVRGICSLWRFRGGSWLTTWK
jgi:putative MATE family efflux protein